MTQNLVSLRSKKPQGTTKDRRRGSYWWLIGAAFAATCAMLTTLIRDKPVSNVAYFVLLAVMCVTLGMWFIRYPVAGRRKLTKLKLERLHYPEIYWFSFVVGLLVLGTAALQGQWSPSSLAFVPSVLVSVLLAVGAYRIRRADPVPYAKDTEAARQLLFTWLLVFFFIGNDVFTIKPSGADSPNISDTLLTFILVGVTLLAVGRGYTGYVEGMDSIPKGKPDDGSRG